MSNGGSFTEGLEGIHVHKASINNHAGYENRKI